MIKIIDIQRYHMELALIIFLRYNDYHARFMYGIFFFSLSSVAKLPIFAQ